MNDYSDIINTKWPKEDNFKHPKMPLKERAKIFLPFAALKGYSEAINDVENEHLVGIDSESSSE